MIVRRLRRADYDRDQLLDEPVGGRDRGPCRKMPQHFAGQAEPIGIHVVVRDGGADESASAVVEAP